MGESFVWRAQQTTPFPASMELGALIGMDGFVLNGEQANDNSGISVACAGAVNGDLIDDLIIGANFESLNGTLYAGKSYVVFGSGGLGGSGTFALSSFNGTTLYTFTTTTVTPHQCINELFPGSFFGNGISFVRISSSPFIS